MSIVGVWYVGELVATSLTLQALARSWEAIEAALADVTLIGDWALQLLQQPIDRQPESTAKNPDFPVATRWLLAESERNSSIHVILMQELYRTFEHSSQSLVSLTRGITDPSFLAAARGRDSPPSNAMRVAKVCWEAAPFDMQTAILSAICRWTSVLGESLGSNALPDQWRSFQTAAPSSGQEKYRNEWTILMAYEGYCRRPLLRHLRVNAPSAGTHPAAVSPSVTRSVSVQHSAVTGLLVAATMHLTAGNRSAIEAAESAVNCCYCSAAHDLAVAAHYCRARCKLAQGMMGQAIEDFAIVIRRTSMRSIAAWQPGEQQSTALLSLRASAWLAIADAIFMFPGLSQVHAVRQTEVMPTYERRSSGIGEQGVTHSEHSMASAAEVRHSIAEGMEASLRLAMTDSLLLPPTLRVVLRCCHSASSTLGARIYGGIAGLPLSRCVQCVTNVGFAMKSPSSVAADEALASVAVADVLQLLDEDRCVDAAARIEELMMHRSAILQTIAEARAAAFLIIAVVQLRRGFLASAAETCLQGIKVLKTRCSSTGGWCLCVELWYKRGLAAIEMINANMLFGVVEELECLAEGLLAAHLAASLLRGRWRVATSAVVVEDGGPKELRLVAMTCSQLGWRYRVLPDAQLSYSIVASVSPGESISLPDACAWDEHEIEESECTEPQRDTLVLVRMGKEEAPTWYAARFRQVPLREKRWLIEIERRSALRRSERSIWNEQLEESATALQRLAARRQHEMLGVEMAPHTLTSQSVGEWVERTQLEEIFACPAKWRTAAPMTSQ